MAEWPPIVTYLAHDVVGPTVLTGHYWLSLTPPPADVSNCDGDGDDDNFWY